MTKSFFSNFIRNRDWFGNPIQLNFNKKGSSHNTFFGGLLSVLVNVAMITYCLIFLEKMLDF